MLPTGFLRQRLVIQKPTPASDGQGGQTRTYAAAGTVNGAIRETNGQTFSESEGRMIAWNAAVAWVDVRSDASLTPAAGDRIVFGGVTFEVLSQVGQELLIKCELKRIVV